MQRTFAQLKVEDQNQEGQCKAEKEGAEPVREEHGQRKSYSGWSEGATVTCKHQKDLDNKNVPATLSIKECCTDSEDGMSQYSEENKEKMIGNLKAFELQKES